MKQLADMTPEEVLAERDRRDERRRRGLPLIETETPLEVATRLIEEDNRLEKAIQADVIKLYRRFGCVIYSLSQPRATKQTPGLGDLFGFTPMIYIQPSRLAFWHETKTVVGKLRPDQREFHEFCLETAGGCRHVVGGLLAAEEFLVHVGVCDRLPDGSLSRRKW